MTGQSGHQTTTMRGIAAHPASASGGSGRPPPGHPLPGEGRTGGIPRPGLGGRTMRVMVPSGDGSQRRNRRSRVAAPRPEMLTSAWRASEVAVALAEALPGAGGDGQAQVGRLGPGADGDEDCSALAGPGREAAGLGGGEAGRGADEHDVDRVQEGGDHGRPGPGAGDRDQGEALEGDAGLGGGDDPQVGQADRGDPGAGRRGPGDQGQGEGGGAGDGHRRAPAKAAGRGAGARGRGPPGAAARRPGSFPVLPAPSGRATELLRVVQDHFLWPP